MQALGGNSFGNTGMGLQPQVVMQAAVSLFNNSEKQHKPSQEQEKLPTAAQSTGAGHAEDSRAGHRGTTTVRNSTSPPKSRRSCPRLLRAQGLGMQRTAGLGTGVQQSVGT